MRRILCVLAVALVLGAAWGSPALARDVDEGARTRIKKLQTRVEELETKVTALQLLVQRLEAEDKALKKEIQDNQALIQLLIKQATRSAP